jgi:hypothetical protein
MSPNSKSIMATSAAATAGSSSTNASQSGGDAGKQQSNAQQILVTLAVNALELGIVIAGSYYLSGWLSKKIQSQQLSRPSNEEARKRLEKMLTERAEKEALDGGVYDEDDDEAMAVAVQRQLAMALDLNEYETAIAEDVIDPTDIDVTFRDVGGIDPIKTELFDLVVLPLLRPDLFRSDSGLVTPPRGILLYGAPGVY